MKYAITLDKISKNFGKKQVLDNLTMRVPENSIYGFLGINGAGKTTTFGILSSFLPQGDGKFEINGKLGVLPQDAKFYHGRSAYSQLSFFALLSGVKRKDVDKEVIRVLTAVDLYSERKTKVHTYSHGMTNKLALAQALLGDPDVLLLDEPTSGLDPKNVVEIRKLIQKLGEDKTVVISSHILSEIDEICDYIGILDEGIIKFEGPISEITESHNCVNIIVDKPVDTTKIINISFVDSAEFNPEKNMLTVYYDSSQTDLALINKAVISELFSKDINIMGIVKGNTLEDSFLNLLK